MMKTKFRSFLICSAMIALTAARVLPSRACATMALDPKDSVVVTNESAVIVWDAQHHREHFIRGATFKSTARDIGFLVPSPTVPELKVADHAAFEILKKALEPKVEHRTKSEYRWSLIFSGKKIKNTFSAASNTTANATDIAPSAGTTKAAVRVLQTKTVAGYDATTLKANDANALNKWLSKNGYLAHADFKDWLAPYVKNGWVITAFKIRKRDAHSKQFSSALVRMSFQTAKPFFPYREAANQREGIAKKRRAVCACFSFPKSASRARWA